MSKQVKLRRGTATQHASFTGVVGEVTVDTTNSILRVHDGATAGGIPTAKAGVNTDITALDQDVVITPTGTIAANTLGYRGLPQNNRTGAYTLALSDIGKQVTNTTGGWTIPANSSVAFPVGATIVLFNNSSSSQNISITSDTLRQAGTANTGTRALAQYGLATCVKVDATTWAISGAGLS
jgi:hypothetical protein